MPLPTTRLVLLVAALAPLFLLGTVWPVAVPLTQLGLLALGLLAAGDAWLAGGRARLQLRREVPATAAVHRPLEVAVTLELDGPDRTLLLSDTPPASFAAGAQHRRSRSQGGRAELRYSATPLRRGPARFGPVEVRLQGPLGLARRRHRFTPERAALSVVPDLAVAARQALACRAAFQPGGGGLLRRHPGHGREFESLREYVRGDDVRLVDWKATARHARPIVRRHQAEQHQNLMLVLDAGRQMTGRSTSRRGPGAPTKLDSALEAALGMAAAALDGGDRVGALLFDRETRLFLPPAGGRRQLLALAQGLGAAQPRLVEPDYGAALEALARRLRRRCLICIFTDLIDSSSGETLAAAQAYLARRHLPFVAALRDPDLDRLSRQPFDAAGPLLERLAARQMLALRTRALAGLARHGATVIEAPADTLSAAVIDAYLDAKARGRL